MNTPTRTPVTYDSTWDSATTYQPRTIALVGNVAYLAKSLNTNVPPAGNPGVWVPLGGGGGGGSATGTLLGTARFRFGINPGVSSSENTGRLTYARSFTIVQTIGVPGVRIVTATNGAGATFLYTYVGDAAAQNNIDPVIVAPGLFTAQVALTASGSVPSTGGLANDVTTITAAGLLREGQGIGATTISDTRQVLDSQPYRMVDERYLPTTIANTGTPIMLSVKCAGGDGRIYDIRSPGQENNSFEVTFSRWGPP